MTRIPQTEGMTRRQRDRAVFRAVKSAVFAPKLYGRVSHSGASGKTFTHSEVRRTESEARNASA